VSRIPSSSYLTGEVGKLSGEGVTRGITCWIRNEVNSPHMQLTAHTYCMICSEHSWIFSLSLSKSAALFLEVYRLEQSTGLFGQLQTFPGKRPQMDVGFGLCPAKCYSKPVKIKFVTRNSNPERFCYCVEPQWSIYSAAM